ncbi:TonB-dependent receptor domain-containing protein [Zunongwangia endophytica]|uniref:TonB-dependent receptor domain-containing protein n=1 Tax=Zunongwangia endophytica TaxID=1808945 RepID=UPI0025B2CFC6|nr:TonB-dependent receptor [Zunongwangia endophytica]MDN3596962.1 TonB-dependent receptor [Zunongwangia endophytica]
MFPSGALAWNMHNEDFLREVSFVNQLKLRASLGRVGSDNLPSFTYLSYYQALENGDSYYDGQNGIAVTGVPNTGIRWEETDQLDLGAEFSLFNNRLEGEIVYYEKNTSGIILFSPIPAETGFNSWNTNIADVSNKGWR